MKLSFTDQKMFLSNVNGRAELHGEEREPAGDIKLEVDCSNDTLSEFHPSLKSALYHFDGARPADLSDEGKRGEPGYLPHLKLQQLTPPLKWQDEMIGVAVAIRQGKQEVALSECKVNGFAFEPKDGGTISLVFRVQAHPQEKDFGRLMMWVQSEVRVDITPEELE